MAEADTTVGGHDYFFLDDPPSDVVCPICHLVASNPQQVSCCGKIYCLNCFTELKQRSKWVFRCANCREEDPTAFSDRKTAGQINALRVTCTMRDGGCDWRGALREMSAHLRRCQYSETNCPFSLLGCSARPLRKDLELHEEENMKLHLNLTMKKVEELEGGALKDCKSLEKKLTKDVAETKKSLVSHKRESKQHLERQLENYKHETDERLRSLKDEVACEHRLPPVVFKLTDFSYLQDEDEDWHSAPFYTHLGGYQMCLRLYTNGSSDVRGTHLSCYVYLMRGNNDEQLEWPFRGMLHVELLNQLEDAHHHVEKITFHSMDTKNYNKQVKKGCLGVTGLGRSKFISQSELGRSSSMNRQYLKDDCLFIRVSKVEVTSVTRPWLSNAITSKDEEDDDDEEFD